MTESPNIILFVTDDHAPWTLPIHGNTECETPNFDQFAKEGTIFEKAYTPSPVCSPARACVFTGKTPSQHGVHDWIDQMNPKCEDRDWLEGHTTLSEYLTEKGYQCSHSGKWHLGQTYKAPRGYENYFGLPGFTGMHNGPTTFIYQGQALSLRGNLTTMITDYALEFLNQRDQRPFFLSIGYVATHSPFLGHDPKRVEHYRNATFKDIPQTSSHPWRFNEDFPQDDWSEEDCRERYRHHYAAVSETDHHFGRIMDFLKKHQLDNNTLVVYTSDHGLALGHQGFWGKGNGTRPLNMYEISTRVPLLMRQPGIIPAGKRIERPVDHYDTFQFICEQAKIIPEKSSSLPGKSYLPLLSDRNPSDWEDTRFGEYGDLRMIRTEKYKYVKRYPEGPHDLFDLINDPNEEHNLIDSEDHQDLLLQLDNELEQWYSKYEDPQKSGLKVKKLPMHNPSVEAWRDGLREERGLQIYD